MQANFILEEYSARIDASIKELVSQAVGDKKENGWVYGKRQHGISCYSRYTAKSPVKCVMGDGVIAASRERISAICKALDHAAALDPMFFEGRILESPSSDHDVIYSVYNIGAFFSNRDCCYLETRQDVDDMKVVSIFSVDHPQGAPVDGRVRAHIYSTGFVIRPMLCGEQYIDENNVQQVATKDDEGNLCQVWGVFQLNPGGYLPIWLVNLIGGEEPLMLHRIRNVLRAHSTTSAVPAGTPKPDDSTANPDRGSE